MSIKNNIAYLLAYANDCVNRLLMLPNRLGEWYTNEASNCRYNSQAILADKSTMGNSTWTAESAKPNGCEWKRMKATFK